MATASGAKESHGLSLLDIVKHAVRTVAHSLTANDSLANNLPCAAIETFGFGYSLDSALLEGITKEGNAMYPIIPDVPFAGAPVVNAVRCASPSLYISRFTLAV